MNKKKKKTLSPNNRFTFWRAFLRRHLRWTCFFLCIIYYQLPVMKRALVFLVFFLLCYGANHCDCFDRKLVPMVLAPESLIPTHSAGHPTEATVYDRFENIFLKYLLPPHVAGTRKSGFPNSRRILHVLFHDLFFFIVLYIANILGCIWKWLKGKKKV